MMTKKNEIAQSFLSTQTIPFIYIYIKETTYIAIGVNITHVLRPIVSLGDEAN